MSFQDSNEMIVGGGGLPATNDSGQFFFASEGRVRSTELSLDNEDGRVSLPSPQRPFLIVGRSERCDVVLDHKDVSFRHAYLQLVGGHVYCVDLASRSGTHWDGKRKASGWFQAGIPITIGPYTIQSRPPEFGPTMATGLLNEDLLSTDSNERYPGCHVELRFLNGKSTNRSGQTWRIRQPITLIGNASCCRMRLNHKSVSRVHCSLMMTPNGLWVADLLGKSGTWVNEEPVDFRLLQDGEEIRVGDFRFAINYRRSPADNNASHHTAVDYGGQSNKESVPRNPVPKPAGNQPSGSSLSEDFMLSMMDKFSAMQQQMTAMSHQQMMVMTQLVGTMHQNHHDLVQQEMDRINKIGTQIDELRAQMNSVAEGQPDTAIEGAERAAISFDPEQESPVQLPAAPVTEEAVTESEPSTEVPAEKPVQEAVDSVEEVAELPRRDRAAPRNAESHSHLIERMAELESERTSRWKKVMQILTGSGP